MNYVYSDEAQDLIAKNFYRPTTDKATRKYAGQFPTIKLFTITEVFEAWVKAQKTHFADGGSFDQIYQPGSGAR